MTNSRPARSGGGQPVRVQVVTLPSAKGRVAADSMHPGGPGCRGVSSDMYQSSVALVRLIEIVGRRAIRAPPAAMARQAAVKAPAATFHLAAAFSAADVRNGVSTKR